MASRDDLGARNVPAIDWLELFIWTLLNTMGFALALFVIGWSGGVPLRSCRLLCGVPILKRKPNAGFEITAIVADTHIAAKVDHFVAEFHFHSIRQLTAEERTV